MRLVLVFLLALTLRCGLAAIRYTEGSTEGNTFQNFENGDYPLYSIGADDFATNHNFRNSLFLVRPPVYPLLVYALQNNDALVVAAGILSGALVAPVTYFLAIQLGLSAAASLIAALIVALDPASIAYSAFLGPEPVANLLIALSVACLLAAVNAVRRALLWGAAAGLSLALASLTRPASYLLWIPLCIWLIIVALRPRADARRIPRLAAVALFMLINAAAVVGWTAHNGVVFGNPSFSTTGPYTMLYYHAAAIQHFVSGKTIEEDFTDINRRIEARLGHDTTNVDEGFRHGYLAATVPVQDALMAESLAIFRAYPLHTLATFPLGFIRMYSRTITLPGWTAVVDIPFNIALLLGTVAGLWLAFRRRQWTLFWCVLLVCAYFTGGILLVKTTGLDTRERSMLTPFMASACAYGIMVARARREG